MSLNKSKLKALTYKAVNNFTFIQSILDNLLKRFITPTGNPSNYDLTYVILTVDTEPGYVNADETRTWEYIDPNASVGYSHGVKNILDLLDGLDIPATFLLSNQCDLNLIKQTGILDSKQQHEIGLHLHVGRNAANLLEDKQKRYLLKFKNKIKKQLGIDPISFRYGVWGANTTTFKLLDKLGFLIDSSICPNIKAHIGTQREYDWTKTKHCYPFWHTNNLLEIPASTLSCFGKTFRLDPLYYPLSKINPDLIRTLPVWVISTHSSEATYKNGSPSINLKMLEKMLSQVKSNKSVKFTTLKGYYQHEAKYKTSDIPGFAQEVAPTQKVGVLPQKSIFRNNPKTNLPSLTPFYGCQTLFFKLTQ